MRKLIFSLVALMFLVTACGSKDTGTGSLTPEQIAQLQLQQQQQQQYYYPPSSTSQYYDQYSQTTSSGYCSGYLTVYSQDGVNLGDFTQPSYQASICNATSTVRNGYSPYGATNSDLSANNPNAQYPPAVYCWDGAALTLFGYFSVNPQYATYNPSSVYSQLGCY